MEEYLAVGYIFSTRGLKGEVKVKPLTNEESFIEGSHLRVNPPLKDIGYLTIEKISQSKNSIVIKFMEISDIDSAEKMLKRYLEVQKKPLAEDTYYTDDLIGLDVYLDNKKIGVVDNIMQSKASDILVVRGDVDVLIPVVKQYIDKVNIDKKKIIVKSIEGLPGS